MFDDLLTFAEGEITQLDPAQFWFGFGFLMCVSLWSFLRMLSRYVAARMIENVPTAKMRSAAQGYVELIGQAKLMNGPVIVSPLSQKMCVWYRYKIEEKVKRYNAKGVATTYWRVVKKHTSEELFLLEDDTGQCVIDPDNADVITRTKNIWYKHDVIPPRRYTEELITENETLYAIGLFKTVANIDSKHFSRHVAELLRQWKKDPNQLLHQFDIDRNNELSESEWTQARLTAERQIKSDHGQRERMEQLNILTASSHKDQRFILSTIPEHKIIRQYKTSALMALIVFFMAGSLAVWIFTIRLGV